jgi:hypothetical protein
VYDEAKVDDMVLALLHLNALKDHGVDRAWKSFDWDAMNRLHEAGLITDPRSKAKSVVLTEEGAKRARTVRTALRNRSGTLRETTRHRRSALGSNHWPAHNRQYALGLDVCPSGAEGGCARLETSVSEVAAK